LRGLERLDYSWEKVRENLSLQDRVEDTALWKVRVKEIMKDIRILNRELTPEEYALIEPILLEAHRKWNNRK
jgi:hypothetical protein